MVCLISLLLEQQPLCNPPGSVLSDLASMFWACVVPALLQPPKIPSGLLAVQFHGPYRLSKWHCEESRKPPNVGFGGTGRKRKRPCTKQCAWRKHGSCDTRLAEACPPKLWNTVKDRVKEMRPKWPFWKHCAPKMRLVEAQCAYRKHCYPETPLWESSHFPKDPAVLKILRVVNLLRVVFLVRQRDLLSRRILCGHHFPGNYRHFSPPRRVHGVVNLGGVVQTLRRSNSLFLLSSRSIFNTEGSFGIWGLTRVFETGSCWDVCEMSLVVASLSDVLEFWLTPSTEEGRRASRKKDYKFTYAVCTEISSDVLQGMWRLGHAAVMSHDSDRESLFSGKEKTHKHKQICGIVPGLDGCQI